MSLHAAAPVESRAGLNANGFQYIPPPPLSKPHHYPSIPAPEPFGSGAPAPAPGHLHAALPQLAPNPWVKDLWKWLSENTTGVARVDLRRPMAPLPEQYDGNLLFASYKHGPGNGNVAAWKPFSGRGSAQPQPHRAPPGQYTAGPPQLQHQQQHAQAPRYAPHQQPHQYPQPRGAPQPQHPQGHAPQPYAPPPGYHQAGPAYGRPSSPAPQLQQVEERGGYDREEQAPVPRLSQPTGARVKITRSFLLGWGESGQEGKPMMDIGGGINVDMDRQRVEPVLRMKLAHFVSIKALPMACLKLSKTLPLGRTGMGLKVHYEVPLKQLHHFYRPPARLMVRLDPMPGSGVRLTPFGVDFDQQSMRFGKNISLRTSAGLAFPRSLPIDPENDDFGLKVHRLSLKALW